jgi:hypothetical protein
VDVVWGLLGTLVGGLIVLGGQRLEAARARERQIEQWRAERDQAARDFKRDSLVALQDHLVELTRAAVQAREHLDDETWEPTRYEGARLRVIGVTSRIHDTSLKDRIDGLLAATARVAGEGSSRDEMGVLAESATTRAAELFESLDA